MIGARIRQARIAAGMTQDELVQSLAAGGISLTKGGLSKYERGGSVPKATVIRAIAKTVGMDASYFLEESSDHVEWLAFRKLARMGTKRQEHVKALAESHLEVFLTLRRALDPAPPKTLPDRKPVRSLDDAESAAESLRKDWRLGEHAIESVTTTIEDGGGVVVEVPSENDSFHGLSGLANGTTPVVVVDADASDDRRRFSLAHELGHLLMDVSAVDSATEEKFAHRFAAAFLVTATTARNELGARRRHLDFQELAMLKQKHGLSMQAWIYRANDLGIIDAGHTRSLFAEMSSRGWRRQEPVSFEGKERPQKLRQLAVRALAEGLLSRSQAERICPGVTRGIDDLAEQLSGPLAARSLMRLPKSDRDRLMEQAAAVVADEYAEGGGLSGLESLSEEDHRDNSVDE